MIRPPSASRCSRFRLAVWGALSALALSGCSAKPQDAKGNARYVVKKHPASSVDETAPYVPVIRLSADEIAKLPRSYSGVVKATRTSELGFKRTGRVEKILVQEGDRVKQGQVLAELDVATLNAELAVVAAERLVAVAKLSELVAGPRKQSIEASRAQLAEVEAMREQQRLTYERTKRLIQSEAISQQSADDARMAFTAAEKRVASQKQVLAELEAGTRSEQIEAQRAGIAQLEASQDRLKLDISESKLLAPFDAVISRRSVDEGAIVSPGMPLMRVVENLPPEVWIGVPSDLSDELREDRTYELSIGAKKYDGKLKSVLPELDAATRTQTVIFTMRPHESPNAKASKNPLFTLGQIAQLNLSQEVRQPGFWLPLQALSRGTRGLWSAFIVEESPEGSPESPDYVIRRSDVEIVQIDSDRVLVRGTVQAGDRIVSSGVHKLTAGQRVRIANEPTIQVRAADTAARAQVTN